MLSFVGDAGLYLVAFLFGFVIREVVPFYFRRFIERQDKRKEWYREVDTLRRRIGVTWRVETWDGKTEVSVEPDSYEKHVELIDEISPLLNPPVPVDQEVKKEIETLHTVMRNVKNNGMMYGNRDFLQPLDMEGDDDASQLADNFKRLFRSLDELETLLDGKADSQDLISELNQRLRSLYN